MTPAGYEEAFLEDSVANPDDDTPRLSYADYLTDRGDLRGEFIRGQCALARLPPDDPQRPELEAKEKELLKKHKAEWAEPLRQFVHHVDFYRGFLRRVTLTAEKFLHVWQDLFRLGPVQHVRLEWAKYGLNRWPSCPGLAYIISLSVSGNQLGAAQVAQIVGSPHLRRLQALDLGGNFVGLSGLRTVLEAPVLERLTTLNLGGNFMVGTLGDGPLRVLAEAPWPPRLAHLILTRNPFSDPGLVAFSASPRLAQLESLTFDNSRRINRPAVTALATSPHLAGLRSLSLNLCRLGPRGIGPLTQTSCRLKGLTTLRLRKTGLNDEAARLLAGSALLSGLKTLDAADNGFGRQGEAVLRERFGDRVLLHDD
jgi:uncharacterized protein (TIGR02996 family)